jgi:hypothetical protein
MGTTSGLVSAYQLLDFSAQRIVAHNLSTTSAEKISVELVSLPYLLKLREKEFVKVKISPEHDQLAFAILVKRFLVEMLPGRVFGISREALKALDEVGISYEVVE